LCVFFSAVREVIWTRGGARFSPKIINLFCHILRSRIFLCFVKFFSRIKNILVQCLACLSDDFPSTLRFLRNCQKLSIKNTTKLGNFHLSDDFLEIFCHLDAPGTVLKQMKISKLETQIGNFWKYTNNFIIKFVLMTPFLGGWGLFQKSICRIVLNCEKLWKKYFLNLLIKFAFYWHQLEFVNIRFQKYFFKKFPKYNQISTSLKQFWRKPSIFFKIVNSIIY